MMSRGFVLGLVFLAAFVSLVPGVVGEVDDPLIAYTFDDGNFDDKVGSNDAEEVLSVDIETGKIGSGAGFSNEQDALNTTWKTSHRETKSISYWVNYDELTNDDGGPKISNLGLGDNGGRNYAGHYDNFRMSAGDTFRRTQSGISASTDQWYHVVVIWDAQNKMGYHYVDGQQVDSFSYGFLQNGESNLGIGARVSGYRSMKGTIDEFYVYDTVLSGSDVDTLYNGGNGYQIETTGNFTVKARDAFDDASLSDFSANLTGQTSGTTYDLNTTSGEIVTPVLSNSSELWNVRVNADGYESKNYSNVNVSQNTTLKARLADNRTRFTTAYTKVTNTTQNTFNITIEGQTFQSNTTFPSPDQYNATYTKTGWYNRTDEYNASLNNTFTGVYDAQVNLTTAYREDNQSLAHRGWIAHPNHAYNESFDSQQDNETIIGLEQRQTPYTAYIEPDNYDSPLPINPFNLTINDSKQSYRKYYYATYQFRILDETDGSPFNIGSTDQTTLQITCPNRSITQTFNSYNKSFAIDCEWNSMKLQLQYPDDSYFRTIIPPLTNRTIDLYAANLNNELIYQVDLKLNDLTGIYENGYARVDTYVNGTNEQITSQYFDIENKVTLYLLKDSTYTLCLYNEDGTQSRCLGELTASSAGTRTITVPRLNLVTGDDNAIGEDTVTYWENTNKTIEATHNDPRSPQVTFTVNDDDNQTIYTTSSTGETTKFTYNKANHTHTYRACITTQYTNDCRTLTPTYGDYLGFGEYLDEPRQSLNLISLAAILFVLFFTAYFSITASLFLTTTTTYTLMTWGMLTWGDPTTDSIIFTVLGFATTIAFITEVIR